MPAVMKRGGEGRQTEKRKAKERVSKTTAVKWPQSRPLSSAPVAHARARDPTQHASDHAPAAHRRLQAPPRREKKGRARERERENRGSFAHSRFVEPRPGLLFFSVRRSGRPARQWPPPPTADAPAPAAWHLPRSSPAAPPRRPAPPLPRALPRTRPPAADRAPCRPCPRRSPQRPQMPASPLSSLDRAPRSASRRRLAGVCCLWRRAYCAALTAPRSPPDPDLVCLAPEQKLGMTKAEQELPAVAELYATASRVLGYDLKKVGLRAGLVVMLRGPRAAPRLKASECRAGALPALGLLDCAGRARGGTQQHGALSACNAGGRVGLRHPVRAGRRACAGGAALCVPVPPSLITVARASQPGRPGEAPRRAARGPRPVPSRRRPQPGRVHRPRLCGRALCRGRAQAGEDPRRSNAAGLGQL